MDVDSRFIKLIGLTLLIALVMYIALAIVFWFLPFKLSGFYHVTVSLFGAGYLVYKFFADAIA